MLTLTTLNVQGYDHWQTRVEHTIQYLQSANPDVIFFQESVYLPEVSAYNPVQTLNQTLNYPYEQHAISRLQVGIEYPIYREGSSILSRYPILKSDVIVLKKEERDEHHRILQLIDIDVRGTVVKLGNVHFSITDFFDLATPQLQETLEILASRNETRILGGDFNITFLEETKHLWENDYIASTDVPYITYPAMNKRVDYFLIPKSLYEFEDIRASAIPISDHHGVTVKLKEIATE